MVSRTILAAVLSSFGSAAQIVFAPPHLTGIGESAPVLPVGDLDGDGWDDVLAWMPDGELASWLGDGEGGFVQAQLVPQGSSFFAGDIELADVDGDLDLDLAVGAALPTAAVAILLGHGDGSFDNPVTVAVLRTDPEASPPRVFVADADVDGDLDLLAVLKGGFWSPHDNVLLVNDGAGDFTEVELPLPLVGSLQDGRLVDLDADGNVDLLQVVATLVDGDIALLTHRWLGVPVGGWRYVGSTAGWVTDVGDLNSDGVVDLVADDFNELLVYLGAGDGTFFPGAAHALPEESLVGGLADIDGDGRLDVLVSRLDPGEAWVLRGDGVGDVHFPPFVLSWPDAHSAYPLQAADVDADGRLDLVTHFLDDADEMFLGAALNATYPAGGPLFDLGGALAGSDGWPIQIAAGSFAGGAPFRFHLWGAPPGGDVFDVVGLSVLNTPFKGGTLVPAPDLVAGPFSALPDGTLILTGTWPTGLPSGLEVALQFWFADPAGPKGYAASSGVRVTLP